jgi:hypothetical protein
VRITDDEQATQFIGLNQVQVDPMTGQPQVQNAVAQMDVDVILETGPDTVTLQSEEFEQLAQIMPQLAALPPPYALALIEASSLPAQRKKKMTELLSGGGEQTPEAQAQAQKQAQMQERAALAEISGKEAEVGLKQAQAQKLLMPEQPKQVDPFEAQIKTGELQLQARELDLKERELSLKERELYVKAEEVSANERVEMARMDQETTARRDQELTKERETLRSQGFDVEAGEDVSGVNLAKVMEGLSTTLDQRIGQLTDGVVAVLEGQARLEQALSAEKELVRDPMTGKAMGVRIKKAKS